MRLRWAICAALTALVLLPAGLACAEKPAAAPQQAVGPAPEPAAPAQPGMTPEDEADVEIGKAAAEEVKKQFKILDDSPAAARLAAIVAKLRPVTEKPYLDYQVRVIDSKALNAFALPGGFLFVTEGIIEAAESEDELAAILGHEMAHCALAHSRRLMSKDERYTKILAPIIVASILTQPRSVDAGKIALVGSLIVQDAVNHYGREAEYEADAAAVRYLYKSGAYNPVAVLTVVEGLTRMEAAEAQVEAGVFQTHPKGQERVQATLAELEKLGVPIERRRVTHSLVASAAAVMQDGREIGELRLNDRAVFRPAAEVDGESPVVRAQHSAEILNALLLSNLELLEVGLRRDGDEVVATARGETLFRITKSDAEFHKSSVDALAQQALTAIRLGFQEEKVKRAY